MDYDDYLKKIEAHIKYKTGIYSIIEELGNYVSTLINEEESLLKLNSPSGFFEPNLLIKFQANKEKINSILNDPSTGLINRIKEEIALLVQLKEKVEELKKTGGDVEKDPDAQNLNSRLTRSYTETNMEIQSLVNGLSKDGSGSSSGGLLKSLTSSASSLTSSLRTSKEYEFIINSFNSSIFYNTYIKTEIKRVIKDKLKRIKSFNEDGKDGLYYIYYLIMKLNDRLSNNGSFLKNLFKSRQQPFLKLFKHLINVFDSYPRISSVGKLDDLIEKEIIKSVRIYIKDYVVTRKNYIGESEWNKVNFDNFLEKKVFKDSLPLKTINKRIELIVYLFHNYDTNSSDLKSFEDIYNDEIKGTFGKIQTKTNIENVLNSNITPSTKKKGPIRLKFDSVSIAA